MDTLFGNDFSCDESALVDDYSDAASLDSISHQDSGLTDEDLFHDQGEYALYHDSASKHSQDSLELLEQQHGITLPATPSTNPTNTSNTDRGPLSPFSPLLQTSHTKRRDSATISWQSSHEMDLSLLPCRKVSVVVHVKVPHENHDKLCLFPLLPPSSNTTTDSMLSPTSATLQAISGIETRDLVAVNPCAFGKYIPAQVTMDTARLVANVVST